MTIAINQFGLVGSQFFLNQGKKKTFGKLGLNPRYSCNANNRSILKTIAPPPQLNLS